jgi:hypothetical protein
MISVAGKLRLTPWDIYAAVANNDVDKAPLLTVGGAQVAVFSGIASVLGLLLLTYVTTQVLIEQNKQTADRLDKVDVKTEGLEDRVTRLEVITNSAPPLKRSP